MEKLAAFIIKAKHWTFTTISALALMYFSFDAMAQTGKDPGQNPDRPSHSEQASSYLHNIEQDPNGVPNSSEWYAQPWIWAIVAAILILIIGLIYKNNSKRDLDSERGLG